MNQNIGSDLPLLRQLDHVHGAARIAPSCRTGISAQQCEPAYICSPLFKLLIRDGVYRAARWTLGLHTELHFDQTAGFDHVDT